MISNETYDVWFAFCVWILNDIAKMFGMSYNAINIWIFCIIGPVVFLILLIVLIRQCNDKAMYKRLYKEAISAGSSPSKYH